MMNLHVPRVPIIRPILKNDQPAALAAPNKLPPELDVEEEVPKPTRTVARPALSASSMDSNVFEPDSPVASLKSIDSEEITIEPVFANQSPPPSVADPSGMHSSLGDLREEDESEAAQEKKEEEERL